MDWCKNEPNIVSTRRSRSLYGPGATKYTVSAAMSQVAAILLLGTGAAVSVLGRRGIGSKYFFARVSTSAALMLPITTSTMSSGR